jgi:hypothetical protein
MHKLPNRLNIFKILLEAKKIVVSLVDQFLKIKK